MHHVFADSLSHSLQYYVRSTKLVLPAVYDALAKGSDPDRMKGALYIMWSKGIGQISRYFVECFADVDAALYAIAGRLFSLHSSSLPS